MHYKKLVILSALLLLSMQAKAIAWSILLHDINTALSIIDHAYSIYGTYKRGRYAYNMTTNNALYAEIKDLRLQLEHYKKTRPDNIDSREIKALLKEARAINNEFKGKNRSNGKCSNIDGESNIKSKLFEAIKVHDTQSVISCLSKLRTVNFYNQYGHTPLSSAASHGHLDIVRLFVKWGADVDVASNDKMKRTPLHFAVKNSYRGVAKFLICKGANQKMIDARGKSPMDYDLSSFYKSIDCY